MKETNICSLCLEPLYNYICVDCLGLSVSRWLELQDQGLLNDFISFHNFLKNHFSLSQESMKCIRCKRINETIICPYCFMKETFFWLSEKDKGLMEFLMKILNFDFQNVGLKEGINLENWQASIISEEFEEPDLNFCEICGNISEYFHKIDGSYICEVCKDENNF